MTENISVVCLTDRYWDVDTKSYAGTEKSGTLICVSVQNDEQNPQNIIPVGIVKMADGTFESVPLQFITAAAV